MKLNNIIEAIMGGAEYQPPSAGPQIMADFYTLEFLKHGTQHIESDREESLQAELDNVASHLIPGLKKHLIYFAGYSIICELRHCLDCATPSKRALKALLQSSNPKTKASVSLWLNKDNKFGYEGGPWQGSVGDYHNVMDSRIHYPAYKILLLIMAIAGMPNNIIKFFSDLIDRDDDIYALEINRPQRELVWDEFNIKDIATCCKVGIDLFTENKWVKWSTSYGGEAWALACKAVLQLITTSSQNDVILIADHIFDLQHNNGGILDKNTEYEGKWLTEMLDIKRNAKSPEEIARFASPYMRRLCRFALYQRFGRNWNQSSLSSKAMSKDYYKTIRQEFINYISHKNLTAATVQFSNKLKIYDRPNYTNDDILGEVVFYPGYLDLKYKPEPNPEWNNENQGFTGFGKKTTFNFKLFDFENGDFDAVYNALILYPTGRTQKLTLERDHDEY